MPMCGWCGSVVSATALTELQNGPTVLRLCPACTETEQGRKMTSALPRHTPRVVEDDEDDEPVGPAPWRTVTVFVVLAALILPLVVAFLMR